MLTCEYWHVHICLSFPSSVEPFTQVGQTCRDCKRPDATIHATDQLEAKAAHPYHIEYAVKYRRELEDKVNHDADGRLQTSSAKKLARSS